MRLTGQGTARTEADDAGIPLDDGGFIMVAMLVGIAVAAIWMAAILPAWRHQMQREKEAELIFRGEAIARAIYLYRQKSGQALPPSLDVLVSRRFLRKKYIDPITGEDFQIVAGATPGGGGTFGALQAGMIGVRSSSPGQSIRVYNGQQLYSQWVFDFSLEQQRSGGGPPTGDGAGPITPPGARGRGGVVAPGGRQGGPGGGIRGGGGRAGRGGSGVQPGGGGPTRGGRGL
jgi:type II secretory pathway pseudopilin PulG